MKNKKTLILTLGILFATLITVSCVVYKKFNFKPVLRNNFSNVEKDELTQLLVNLKDFSHLPLQDIKKDEFEWVISLDNTSQVVSGIEKKIIKGTSIGGTVSYIEQDKAGDFLEIKGFQIDSLNISAGETGGSTGYKRNNLVCIISFVVSGYNSNIEFDPSTLDTSKNDIKISCGYLD